jgi:hypothetical protein
MPRTQVAGGHVTVRGLKDLQRELRRLDKDLPRELGDANQDVARYVVRRATDRARRLGAMQAKAAESLTAARQQRIAAVRFGGARHPEAMGAEFGADRNVPRSTSRGVVQGWNQFRPWRGSDTRAGYFLFPTIRDDTPQIIELYGELIDRLTRKAFPS